LVMIVYDGVRLTSQNCGFYRPIVHPRAIMMWIMVWWYRLGLTPNLSTRALWQPPVLSGGPASRDISGAGRRMDEWNQNLFYPSPWDSNRSLTCRTILRHETSGFTSHPYECVLRIFIALKNPSPWPGSNPRPLGPVASTLTITPLRRPAAVLLHTQSKCLYVHFVSRKMSRETLTALMRALFSWWWGWRQPSGI
jgi:hypothetical protein